MKDKKCDECGSKIVEDVIRNEMYCEGCGLVQEYHPHGYGWMGLESFMRSRGMQDHIEEIRIINSMFGLREARLKVAKL